MQEQSQGALTSHHARHSGYESWRQPRPAGVWVFGSREQPFEHIIAG